MSSPSEAIGLFVTKIDKRGKEIASLSHLILGMEYEDGERGVDKMSLTIDNSQLTNWKLDGDDDIGQGDYLRVTFGTGVATRTVVLRVSGVEGEEVLTIKAKNKGDTIHWEKRSRVWNNMTRSEIVRKLGREHGLTISDIDDTTEIQDAVMQTRMTDAQFMIYLAYQEGFHLSVTQRGLRWAGRKYDKKPVANYTYHYGPGQGDILDFTLNTDVTKVAGRVRASHLDRMKKKIVTHTSDNSTEEGRKTLTNFTGSIKVDSNGERRFIISTEELKSKEGDAPKDAKARFTRSEQRAVKLDIQIMGDARLLPGHIVTVGGLGPVISGLYFIKKIRYSYDAQSNGFTQWMVMRTTGVNRGKGQGSSNNINRSAVFERCRNIMAGLLDDLAVSSATTNELVAFTQMLERVASTIVGSTSISQGHPMQKLSPGTVGWLIEKSAPWS